MPLPIRVLHFADVHIGMENYGRMHPDYGMNTRIVDINTRLRGMIAYVEEHGVDLIVFAGDAFKNRQPNPTLQRLFAKRIQELAALAPVVMIVGNHDVPTVTQRASSLDIYSVLNVPNVLVMETWDIQAVTTARGTVQIAAAPYPLKDDILQGLVAREDNSESDNGENGRRMGDVTRETIEAMHIGLRDLATRAAQSDDPRLLIGHFSVSGAQFGSEREMSLGNDPVVMLSEIADPAWDYVAMGHIHNHQDLTAKLRNTGGKFPPVVYSGSLERISFNEEADRKGFCMINLSRGGTTYTFVPVEARAFRTLHADLRDSDDPMGALSRQIEAADLTDMIVRVMIQATHENERHLRDADIHKLLEGRGVSYVAGIHKEIERPTRSRIGEESRVDHMTHAELLGTWLKTRNTPADRAQQLIAAAEVLVHEVDG